MKKTQLIVFTRPSNKLVRPGTVLTSSSIANPVGATDSSTGSYYYQRTLQPNNILSPQNAFTYRTGGKEIDLYEDISIPVTFTILDIREPDKRKTSWSKTVTIPGTKNNNRIFSHIYEISADSWVTIAGVSVYQSFNPNLRTEVVLLNDGVQVLKGNLQLKKALRDRNGNIEYEVALSGDLTSLFYDVGDSKLNDLDWSSYDHIWSKENVVNSWNGIIKKDGLSYNNFTKNATGGYVKGIFKDADTGRLSFRTNVSHSLQVGDFVRIELNDAIQQKYRSATGEWRVMARTSTSFTVNYFYPISLSPFGESSNTSIGTAYKIVHKGDGYVYPMISWGDEVDFNSFPVTSFAPGFYMKGILDKIMEETNSSYSSTFLNSQFFKRLILIQKKSSYDLNPAEIADRKFWVGLTSSYSTLASGRQSQRYYYLQYTNPNTTATASILPSVNSNKVPFAKESGYSSTASFYDMGSTASGGIGNWREDTYKWVVRDAGEYKLTTTLKFSGSCVMNGFSGNLSSTGTSSFVLNDSLYKYYPGSFYSKVSSPWKATGCGMRIVATLYLKRNDVVTPIGEKTSDQYYMNLSSFYTADNPNWRGFGLYQPDNWLNYSLSVESSNTYFAKDDEVWCEIKYYVQAGPNGELVSSLGYFSTNSFHELYTGDPDGYERNDIRGDWKISLLDQSYIFNDPTPKAVENSNIEGASFLPNDMSCKDFLLTIIKMFNLHIEPDKEVERRYYIEPRDSYYYKGSSTDQFVDWTDKLDTSTIDIVPMGELIAKYYTFENKAESDYWNKKFKEDRGREYSYYKKEVENDFLTNEVKISLPVGSSVMINYPEGSDVVLPSVVQQDTNGTVKPVSNSAPRILFWGGIRPYTAQRGGAQIELQNPLTTYTTGWEILSSITSNQAISATSGVPFSYYPYAGTVDSPQDPYHDINWFNMEAGDFVYWNLARWANANLYNEFWSNMINEISDPASKVIRAKIRLTPQDIHDLDFRKVYVLDGNWLRLQKVIDYDPVTNDLTECEFLKLVSPSKWSRQSISVDEWGQVGSAFDTNPVISQNPIPNSSSSAKAPISTNAIQYAPRKKRPDYGWNNTTPSATLSNNPTIQTNGISNFVASSAKNVKLNGNENQVGDGAENIHISSGNGNFISGGAKNVNIIGTDKKYIQESDVTYINGIRFKNGVALSKSNVLDAGEDVALVKSSNNTTSTIIDAGEDIVINAGSTTYENLVDSGSDRILPDLPDLGVSTLTNPNPRTNSSNGYSITSPTYSIVEYVRQVRFEKS